MSHGLFCLLSLTHLKACKKSTTSSQSHALPSHRPPIRELSHMAKLNWLTFLCPQAGPPEVPPAHLQLPLATTRGRGGKSHFPNATERPVPGWMLGWPSCSGRGGLSRPKSSTTPKPLPVTLQLTDPLLCPSRVADPEMWAHSPHFFPVFLSSDPSRTYPRWGSGNSSFSCGLQNPHSAIPRLYI